MIGLKNNLDKHYFNSFVCINPLKEISLIEDGHAHSIYNFKLENEYFSLQLNKCSLEKRGLFTPLSKSHFQKSTFHISAPTPIPLI